MTSSQNGWPVPGHIVPWKLLPDRTIQLAYGPAGFILAVHALWYHKRIEPIDTGVYDDWGFDPEARNVRDGTDLSNHDSGTAIDLNATRHPRGSADPLDGFTDEQIAKVHERLRWYAKLIGVHTDAEQTSNNIYYPVRWGYDYQSSPRDGMHFEINRGPGSKVITDLANKLAQFNIGSDLVKLNPHNGVSK